ncbi:MAG: UDP-N-acetylmuramoyl-tripeptide--D-alanyl-D-alanine ligase [Bacilli bacterium]|nr:UDP-N-acetylmuramoyl-tripeptide--D-alanyl-D-alanine ligase [Bacilli bacterium]
MNINELSKIIGANLNQEKYGRKKVKHFRVDTRKLKKDDIFIALKGNTDGHDYLKNIKKARGVVVSKDYESTKLPVLKVNDSLEALKKIAIFKRNNYKGKVIAITGSNGKTTTKELLSHILKQKNKVFKTYKNNNNLIGLPLNLTELNNKYQYAVLELGMNHKGEISELSKICKPDLAIITNIGTAHIGNLGSKKEICKAKLEILDGMPCKNLFVNGYDKYLSKNKNAIKVSFNNSNFKITNINLQEKYILFDLVIDKIYKIKYHIPSKKQLTNVALVIAVSLYLGVKPSLIAKGLNSFKTLENRLEITKNKHNIVINDAYNSNIESLLAGLETIEIYKQDKICIIGDILELGDQTTKIYKEIENSLSQKKYNYIFIGESIKQIKVDNALYFDNTKSLIEYYNSNQEFFKNKLIYVKGSNAIKLVDFVQIINKNK